MRALAFLAYLASWLALIVGAVGSWIGPPAPAGDRFGPRGIGGTLLQAAGALLVVLLMEAGPLRPSAAGLVLVLVLAPLAAALFLAAVYAGRKHGLITNGAFAWVRHPMYLAFLMMLIATAALVAAGPRLVWAAALYLAGTELRIAEEEEALLSRHGDAYAAYRRRTRWRYLPGLR